ncbi:MAG: hypothetical protein CMI03_07505 [Oceanospirillaceae bacterium]|uniref:tetratricopeptide repeat protein n=1 Tax=unclassified Thalassolituus TaxID=2624967 RepID=UPI000C4ADB5C|nr:MULTISPECIES: hypothetical protein [unclassified Thalassolituus]MAS24534.1 hypothetical protein [Oceanospirillaceae bacterium]MBS52579.1 hypothetical protein [Oceanospirillaceae bacterium]
MSLLHNVLREIDRREGIQEQSLPLLTAAAVVPQGHHSRWWLLLPALAVVPMLISLFVPLSSITGSYDRSTGLSDVFAVSYAPSGPASITDLAVTAADSISSPDNAKPDNAESRDKETRNEETRNAEMVVLPGAALLTNTVASDDSLLTSESVPNRVSSVSDAAPGEPSVQNTTAEQKSPDAEQKSPDAEIGQPGATQATAQTVYDANEPLVASVSQALESRSTDIRIAEMETEEVQTEEAQTEEHRAEEVQTQEKQTEPSATVRVIRRTSDGRALYLQALSALNNAQPERALNLINQVLDNAPPEVAGDYRTLKLRILLEQKDAGGFLNFYRQNAESSSLNWLAVAAPGLHMLGFSHEAVVPYQKLILRQPDVVNWPLALASAWEDQGKAAAAIAVLENTQIHYALSAEQNRWLQQRLERLR